MMRGLKMAFLFLGYCVVGASGDYAASLLAEEASRDGHIVRDVDVGHIEMAENAQESKSCEFKAERRLRVDASASQWLRLESGAGDVKVEGRAGLREVQVVGHVCASDEDYLEEIQLSLERIGDDIVLSAHYPDRSGVRFWRGSDHARIDLEVAIPMDMPVDLDDGSGGIYVSGTGELRIDDGSGEIYVSDVSGSVEIDDGSGEIEVRNVSGDVEIEDGSGEISLSDIEGSVRVQDGSGEIEAVAVSHDVIIEDDGSGSIEVRDVGGDLIVQNDGSGGIRYSGVEGRVDVPRDKKHHRGR